jgi:hypothetical protein
LIINSFFDFYRLRSALAEMTQPALTRGIPVVQLLHDGGRMLRRVTAIEFVKAMSSGRTGPILTICEDAEGNAIEIVTKFAAGCEQGATHLAREVIAACLAGDLGLPVPEPFIVEYELAWSDLIPDQRIRVKARQSPLIAFGSRFVTGQWSVWRPETAITEPMLPTAAAIFVFDAVIQNPDRQWNNPNCLVKGDSLRIFDHDLAFSHDQILAWTPPWQLGGLSFLRPPGKHIFRVGLAREGVDWGEIGAAWASLSDERLGQYGAAVPAEWGVSVASALSLIRSARENIDACLTEVQRVLS